jgi:hypothetical protein
MLDIVLKQLVGWAESGQKAESLPGARCDKSLNLRWPHVRVMRVHKATRLALGSIRYQAPKQAGSCVTPGNQPAPRYPPTGQDGVSAD